MDKKRDEYKVNQRRNCGKKARCLDCQNKNGKRRSRHHPTLPPSLRRPSSPPIAMASMPPARPRRSAALPPGTYSRAAQRAATMPNGPAIRHSLGYNPDLASLLPQSGAPSSCSQISAADATRAPADVVDPYVLGQEDWAQLTDQQRSSAELLGYCESSWNARTELPKACLNSRWEADPEACRSWDELEPHTIHCWLADFHVPCCMRSKIRGCLLNARNHAPDL